MCIRDRLRNVSLRLFWRRDGAPEVAPAGSHGSSLVIDEPHRERHEIVDRHPPAPSPGVAQDGTVQLATNGRKCLLVGVASDRLESGPRCFDEALEPLRE